MKKNKILVIALVVALILVAAVTTTVLAGPKTGAIKTTRTTLAVPASGVSTPTEADYAAWGCPMMSGNYTAIADLLGLTTTEVDIQLQQGASLAEIAASQGVTEDALVAAILAPMQDYFTQQVTAGIWTQEQADAHLKIAEQHVRQIINNKGAGTIGHCGGTGGMMGGAGGMMNGAGGMMNGAGGMMGGGMMGGGFGGGAYGRGGMMGSY